MSSTYEQAESALPRGGDVVLRDGSTVRVRPMRADDEPFLFALYCSTRADEIATWGWEPAQREETHRPAKIDLSFAMSFGGQG